MRPFASSASSSSHASPPSLRLSSVTVAVDKATSEILLTPDWTIIISICDSILLNPWQCKDAIKAVKRRLHHKSSKVQLLTLTLVEAMLKNCGEMVHCHIAERHLLEDMVKIVKTKKGEYEVRNRIMILVDTWNEAFNSRKFPHYNWAHQQLTRSGVKFPQRSKEAPLMLAPPPQTPSSSMDLVPIGSVRRLDEAMATETETLSISSLDSMRNVMDLMNDMVQASDKSGLKDELIVDLVEQCRSNQKKLIQMLTTTADEDVMARGLELNDSLQVVLGRHDAIVSGVSFPMYQPQEASHHVLQVAPDSESSSSSSSSSESETDEGKDVKNDFMHFTKRHALLSNELNDNNDDDDEEEEETLLLGNKIEKTAEIEVKTQCNDLALFDVTTKSKSEQNIIELLSLTLSTTAIPCPKTETQPPSNTQYNTSFKGGDDNILMNCSSYVVPWAQSHAEPRQVQQNTSPSSGPNQFQPWLLPQQWNNGGQANSNDTTMWNQRSNIENNNNNNNNNVFVDYSNSFGVGTSGSVGVDNQTYLHPYKLFQHLKCNADGGGGGGVSTTK
ncbi:unnamed protein product [Cochlearia groenlandica]